MNLRVPGDKSITQRALILAALAEGESRLSGLLSGADPRATASVMRQLGATIPELEPGGGAITVRGRGASGLSAPERPLDCENSGTCARLLLGALAGTRISATVTGDESLRSRPMRRITAPLEEMGARFEELGEPDRLPIRVYGSVLSPAAYSLPIASAQVKSAILLAGLVGGVEVEVVEPHRSRDHTERFLRMLGCPLEEGPAAGGWRVALHDPPGVIAPFELAVPGDFSSAAFLLAFALLGGCGAGGVTIEDVGLNPTRTGLLPILRRMGADIRPGRADADRGAEGAGGSHGEPVGDLEVAPASLSGIDLTGEGIATFLDEIPVLAVVAARAEGETRITGAGELRVKETDRIAALVSNLRAIGVEAKELEDGLVIRGGSGPLRGRVRCHGDHRIAMAFGVLGALTGNAIEVDQPEVVEVSFPGFWSLLRRAEPSRAAGSPAAARSGPASWPGVITIDGPAGSGKTSTARDVAEALELRHLDSGALYRALTWALLRSGIAPEDWASVDPALLDRFDIHLEPAGRAFRIEIDGRSLADELRSEEVTGLVSIAARVPAVRDRLMSLQREAASLGGLVAEGRDLGTVVFPDAQLKIFLDADLSERARRRYIERERRPPAPAELAEEVRKLAERDDIDAERDVAPLRKPEGAKVIDTTGLTPRDQVARIVEAARAVADGEHGGGGRASPRTSE